MKKTLLLVTLSFASITAANSNSLVGKKVCKLDAIDTCGIVTSYSSPKEASRFYQTKDFLVEKMTVNFATENVSYNLTTNDLSLDRHDRDASREFFVASGQDYEYAEKSHLIESQDMQVKRESFNFLQENDCRVFDKKSHREFVLGRVNGFGDKRYTHSIGFMKIREKEFFKRDKVLAVSFAYDKTVKSNMIKIHVVAHDPMMPKFIGGFNWGLKDKYFTTAKYPLKKNSTGSFSFTNNDENIVQFSCD